MPDSRSDQSLLRSFVNDGCESSFEVLVRRHSGLIFNVALRVTGSRSLAEEATQIIFVTVARKARDLGDDSRALSGWLHRATVLEATKLLRREGRHQRKKAAIVNEDTSTKLDNSWKDALPCLDVALNKLPRDERQLVLWHYAEGLTFPTIARRLGKTTVAVQKKGQRALVKLQKILKSRGVRLSGVVVASMLTNEMAKGAPVTLLPTLTPLALARTPILSVGVSTFVMTTQIKILIPIVILLLCGVPLAYKVNELQNLKLETAQLTSQLDDRSERRVRHVVTSGRRTSERSSEKATLSELPRMAEVFYRNDSRLLKDWDEFSEYEVKLGNCSPDEIFELLENLSELDIPSEWKVSAYRMMLFDSFNVVKYCPRILDYAVNFEFYDFLRDERELMAILRLWSYEQGEESVAWLDEQVENGKLAGKLLALPAVTQRRLSTIAFSALVSTDVPRALARIAKRPGGSRGRGFNGLKSGVFRDAMSLEASGVEVGSLILPSGEAVPSSVVAVYTSDLLLGKGPDVVAKFVLEHFPDRSSQQRIVTDTLRRYESDGLNKDFVFPFGEPGETQASEALKNQFLVE